MNRELFRTTDGKPVTAVTAAEMAAVDRVAVEEFSLGVIQMMEHAGRTLSRVVLGSDADRITVVAGGGGNGGGGLACARHLAARDRLHAVICDRPVDEYVDAPATQQQLLANTGVGLIDATANPESAMTAINEATHIVDALIGYGLTGAPRGIAAELIDTMDSAAPVTSLDLPSGIDATTGEAPGAVVDPETTVTLALPKTGLAPTESRLVCADLGIPPAVYDAAGIDYDHPAGDRFRVDLVGAD
jgi:NAD(P)H-hydrate epimerase